MHRFPLTALAVLPLLFASPTLAAPCTTAGEAQAVRESLESYRLCNQTRLSSGPGAACNLATAPACSSDLVEDAMALAFGEALVPDAAAPAALASQLSCQLEIGAAVAEYTAGWLEQRVGGADALQADAAVQGQLDRIVAACQVPVAAAEGRVLPRVGVQCAAALPDAGASVDAASLRDCAHTLLAGWVERIGPEPRAFQPNIVFIFTDDQRFDTLGDTVSEPGRDVMPLTLAEIASQGVTFTTAFSATPLCAPNRATILSGSYAHRHLVRSRPPYGGAEVFDDSATIATRLSDAGYRTALIGKYMNSYQRLWSDGEPPYVPPGWDRWFATIQGNYFDYVMADDDVEVSFGSDPEDYKTDVLRAVALEFIDSAVASSEPFFLYLPLNAPHPSGSGGRDPAPRHAGLFDDLPPYRPPSFQEADVSDKPAHTKKNLLPDGVHDENRLAHLEKLQAVDEAVEAIMQRLRSHGIADDTFVIFASDNGYLWGEHRLTAKNKPFEESIRVPLLVRYPRFAPLPRTEARLVNSVDFAPTFLELAGAEPLPQMDGNSLVSLLEGTARDWPTEVLTEAWPNLEFATVRGERWKYTELTVARCPPAIKFVELYDLENDPWELENLDLDPAQDQRKAEMAARLRELRPTWPHDAVLECSHTDDDFVPDPIDNCVEVSNPGQEDVNGGVDDDSSVEGVQHYGDACDADLDDDGLVGASDFLGVFRPCLGADPSSTPACAAADLDGDGTVGASDFFGVLGPAFGTSPGPGLTEP